MSKRTSDAELVSRCCEGDEAAWVELVDRYENLVFSTALATGLDRDSCVDVYQQVWVELHRSLLRLRDPKALPRWLIVTARRLAYRHAVRESRWVSDVREDLADPTPRADTAVVALERRQELERALQELNGRCREVLTALFLSRRKTTYAEIAKRHGLAEGAIGALRSRCLNRLRNLMEASG